MRPLITLILAALAFLPVTAYAQSEPDAPENLNVEEVKAFRDVAVTGDFLTVFKYTIAYSTLPDDSADVNFLFRLRLADGTTLGVNTPYPYRTDGYGIGVASLYMSQAQTQAQGWTDANGTWIDWPLSDVEIFLEGNPTIFTVPETFEYELSEGGLFSSGDYSNGSGETANRNQLASHVISLARIVDQEWGVGLLTSNDKLAEGSGADYFTLAIPGLRQMAPTAFSVLTQAPVVPTPATGLGHFASDTSDRFEGIDWLDFDAIGGDLNFPAGSFSGVLIALGVGFAMFVAGKTMGPTGVKLVLLASTLAVPVFTLSWLIDWRAGMFVVVLLLGAAVVKVARDYLL